MRPYRFRSRGTATPTGSGASLCGEIHSRMTNQVSATAPTLNTMLPGIRIQTSSSMIGRCMNSAERAYQYPLSIAARSCVPLILARDRYNAFDTQGRRRWPPALHRQTSCDFGESEQDKHVTLVAANAFPEPCILLHCGGNNDLPAVGTFLRHI